MAEPERALTPESLRYNTDGLVAVVAQQYDTGEVLMVAWMDAEAVRRTLASGEVTYWSRSRAEYWRKGATSGNTQRLVELRHDCDGDALLALVDQTGPACHTGTRSCFDPGRRIAGAGAEQPVSGPAQ
ncbi:phosphoribosyl-AMP cyclohydrolase [Nakamurella aerolata]|uniref:Phosphoribosyl-AMP cyclohydrolase n=1 Tax=Nakamurella aerolata TaxID=1656892 RepID=A0A849A1V6_9ACTN|nr:phosphoribosyl-AMP cyclohydrolase [Nakamurella aerolata]NNG34545.1 phosphoribosyl-AMP cyclohydrolase [Nakamurella aerolata]